MPTSDYTFEVARNNATRDLVRAIKEQVLVDFIGIDFTEFTVTAVVAATDELPHSYQITIKREDLVEDEFVLSFSWQVLEVVRAGKEYSEIANGRVYPNNPNVVKAVQLCAHLAGDIIKAFEAE